jgi:hypothetical protein
LERLGLGLGLVGPSQVKTRQDKTLTGQNKTRQGKTSKTRQDNHKTRQETARQDNHNVFQFDVSMNNTMADIMNPFEGLGVKGEGQGFRC